MVLKKGLMLPVSMFMEWVRILAEGAVSMMPQA